MRRREKRIRPEDGQGGPAIEQLLRFDASDWLTELEAALKTDDEIYCLALRRWMDARSVWAEREGFKRGDGYARLEALRRQLYPPIHDAIVTTQERSELALGGHDS